MDNKNFKIQNADGTIYNAGNGINILWEVF